MVFEILMEGAKRRELLLVNGGLCHWHLRRDGQLTIREIIVLPERQRQGIGTAMLEILKGTSGATSLFAKCPSDLAANSWYQQMGFEKKGTEHTRSGKELSLWRLYL